jgi:hypothetical protein
MRSRPGPGHDGPAAVAGLTARRRQLGLPVGSMVRTLPVWETTFVGGEHDGRTHRLVAAPERWAVYRHRQAVGIAEVRQVHEPRPQSSLWTRHLYERVYESEGRATYRPVLEPLAA